MTIPQIYQSPPSVSPTIFCADVTSWLNRLFIPRHATPRTRTALGIAP